MDRSIASLSSGGRSTRDSSPSSSRILAGLESQTSALGHVGLLKWQRNDLNEKLSRQKELTASEKKNAASARKLALRLAAQIAVKEAQLQNHSQALAKAHGSNYVAARKNDAVIKDLEAKLADDVTRANSLLRSLGGPESSSRHDGVGFHVSRPLSPPLSPFTGKEPFGKRARSRSAQKLPSEILQLCQLRAETLLRECSDQHDSIQQLQQTEASLRRTIYEKTTEISRLEEAKNQTESQLVQAGNEIQRLEADNATNRDLVQRLSTEKHDLEAKITELKDNAVSLVESRNQALRDLQIAQLELERFNRQNEQTSGELLKANEALEKAIEARKEAMEKIERLQTEFCKVQSQTTREKTSLKSEIEALQAEVGKHQADLKEHESSAVLLRQQIQALEDAKDATAKQHGTLLVQHEETVKTMVSQIEELKSRASGLETETSAAQHELERLKQTEASLGQKLKDSETAHAQAVEDARRSQERHDEASAASSARVEELNKQTKDLQDLILAQEARSDDDAKSTQKLRIEIAVLISQRDEAVREAETRSQRLEEIEGQINAVKNELSTAESRAEEESRTVASLQNQLRDAIKHHDETKRELEAFHACQKEDQQSQMRHIKELQDRAKELELELETTQQTVKGHERLRETSQQDLRIVQDEKEKLSQELENLRKSHSVYVDWATARSTEAEQQITRLKDQICSLDGEKSELVSVEAQLRHIIEGHESKIAMLQQNEQTMRMEHENQQDAAKSHATNLENQIHGLKSGISELQGKVEEHEKAEISLRSSMHDYNLMIRANEEKTAELQSMLEKANESLRINQDTLTSEQENARQLEVTRDQLQLQIANQEKRTNVSNNVIKSFREQVATAESAIASLEKDKADAAHEILETRAQLTTVQEVEQQLRSKVKVLEDAIDEHETLAANLQSRLDKAQAAETSSSTTISDLSSQLDGANEKLLQVQAQFTECSMKLAEAQKLRDEANVELSDVRKAHSSTTDTLERERSSVRTLNEYLDEERKATASVKTLLASVQCRLDHSKTEHSKLQTARLEVEEELRQSRSERDQLSTQLHHEVFKREQLAEQLNAASSSHAALQDELASLRTESQKADGEMSQLRQSLASAMDSSNMYDLSSKAAEQKVNALSEQLASLEAQIHSLQELERENLEQNAVSQRSMTELQKHLSQAQAAETDLKSNIQRMTDRVEELEKSKSHVESELRTSRIEIQSLRETNETLRQEIAHAKAQWKYVEAKRVQAEEGLISARESNTRLEADKKRLASEVTQAQSQSKDLEDKRVKFEQDLASAHVANIELENSKAQLTATLTAKDEAFERSQNEKNNLQARLAASEATVDGLHREIKHLETETRATHSQLRKSQAIRVSHENALGSIRVRLGASKMAKRGVQIKLTQAEKDLGTLTMQKERLEATLSNALSDVVEGRNTSAEQKQKIADLRERNERLDQRIRSSEDNTQMLREALQQMERESVDYKSEISRLKAVVDQAQTEIHALKGHVVDLGKQHAQDQEEIKARRKSIEIIQQAKADLEKQLAWKTSELATQQEFSVRLEQEAAVDRETIRRLENEKTDLLQRNKAIQSEVKHNAETANHRSKIEQLERELRQAQQSAQDLKNRLQEKEKQNAYLRQQHEQYEREVPILRDQVSELRVQRYSQNSVPQIRRRPSENTQPDRRSIRSDEALSTYASSPTLVMQELEPPIEEDEREEYFDVRPSSVRPMSRMGTGRSSLKAFKVLGAEAAQGQLGQDTDDDTKKQLWDMWASQQRPSSRHDDQEQKTGQSVGDQRPVPSSHLTVPRLRRKLTKKKKVEEFKPGEHGKFYNLVHYGSMSRPQFERASTPGIGRSFSSKQ